MFCRNVARGMTLVVLSNGGGVGVGRAINGGNGIVLDGNERTDEIIRSALSWDVMAASPAATGPATKTPSARRKSGIKPMQMKAHHNSVLAEEELIDSFVH